MYQATGAGFEDHAWRFRCSMAWMRCTEHSNVLGAVIFPHNIGLGCTRNRHWWERAERVTAEEVRASGINWAFAPCVTVPQESGGPHL